MGGVPLHPAIVHFPIALSVLLPLAAVIALFVTVRTKSPRAWFAVVGLSALLTISAFVALRTGQNEEERVEKAVPERVLEAHEEAAERFLVVSGILLLVVAAGLAPGRWGGGARIAGTLASVVVLMLGFQVGKAGGELVYKHGATQVYISGSTPTGDDDD